MEVETSTRIPAPRFPTSPLFVLEGYRPIWGDLKGDRLRISDGGVTVAVEYANEVAHLTLHDDLEASWYVAAHRVLPLALGELLRARRTYYLHAGAMEKAGRAVVLLGDSGVGKSTLCYLGLGAGWRCVADDGVLIRQLEDEARCYPFYLEFAMNPARLRPADRARCVEVEPTSSERRFSLQLTPEEVCMGARIGGFAQLRRAGSSSAYQALPAADMLAEFLRQNGLVSVYPPLARSHWATLAELTRRHRTGVMRLAHDVLESTETVDWLLRAGAGS